MPELTLRFDPHVHTDASYDGRLAVPDLLERASEVGLDAVGITDHDTVASHQLATELAPEYGLVVVPGVEVSTADGHLLALGGGSRPEPGRPLPETVRQVRSAGGLAVVPHPFQRTRHGARKRDIDDVDGIEVYNALAMTGLRNRHARQFAATHEYPMLGGSDAHTVELVGRAWTEVTVDAPTSNPADVTPEDLLAGIRAGATTVRGRRASLGRYLRKYARNARYRPEIALKRRVGNLL